MHDLPSQTLLQQAHARQVAGEDLEVMGKRAACMYACGECGTLSEAVVEVVKHAALSPEQVKRVVEFTNQNAYLTEFKKEGSNRYVEFHGGPANPAEVLQDLNDGGGGTVFDRGLADYANPPPSEKMASVHVRNRAALGLEKVASVVDRDEQGLQEMFAVRDVPLPYADPYQDSIAMRDKLASARESLTLDLSRLETGYHDVCERLYGHVKQAAMEGTPLGHVLSAWGAVTPGAGYVKCAFQVIGPRLVEEGVFPSLGAMAGSLEKTAAASSMPNPEHPVLRTFTEFCSQLNKLAEIRVQRDEVDDYFSRIDWFVKKAVAGGLIGGGWHAAKDLAGTAGKYVGGAAGVLHPSLAKPAQWAVSHAPEAAAAIGAKELYDREVKYGPVGVPVRYAKSLIPGTQENAMREYRLQQNQFMGI